MKHNFKIILIIIVIFLAAQFIGLYITSHYLTTDLPYGIEKPEFDPDTSFVPFFIFIIAATIIALFLSRFKSQWLWKAWFLLTVLLTLMIAFNVLMPVPVAFALAVIFAFWKVFRNNFYVHNFTELFIYGGLISIFANSFSILSAFILLILISIYDMIAVWKTKHMIKLAKFQSKLKIFAGILVPYGKNKMAILGGGDVAFPLLFVTALYPTYGLYSLIVSLFAALALFLLFLYSKKKKFYPAMPFVTTGCVVSYLEY